jgi:NAD(P)-dependent dehydrogenase (short-subunit alcohol dehydrogenase family)
MGRLEGRGTMITGAASGIGRATSLVFAREGASVLCFDRADAVDETAEMVRKAGGKAIAMSGDAGKEEDVKAAIDKAAKDFGSLDAVYANAGISGGYASMDELTADFWMEVLRINLIGPFLAIKHASPIMREKGKGSIICTASVAGIRSGAGGIPYSASKAGVINLVQTSANVLYGTGVRVNAICPGLIETGMTKPIFDRARRPDRTAEPAEARRRTARDRRRRPVPGVRRFQLRQRPGHRRRRRPLELAPGGNSERLAPYPDRHPGRRAGIQSGPVRRPWVPHLRIFDAACGMMD